MATLWRVCRLFDPAIDTDDKHDGEKQTDLGRYMLTRDEDALVFLEGATPVWFYLRPMKMSVKRDYVDAVAGDEERYLRAFEACLDHITGLARGRVNPDRKRSKSGLDLLAPDALDKLHDMGLGDACFKDVGAAAYWRATLPLDCAAGYQAPQSSVRGLAGRTYLRRSAEPSSQPSPSKSSHEVAPTLTAPRPSDSGEAGASGGAATVSPTTTETTSTP